jgi:hypothetical protein
MLQASTEVEFTLVVSFSCHRWHTYNHLPMLQDKKDTASVNSTSVDACSIGKWLYVCHLWQEKDTASVNSTSVDVWGRVNTGCVFLLSQMTHIPSLTNATGINRGRVYTGCIFLVSQMTHIQPLTNATGINRGRVNTGCGDTRKTQTVLTLPLLMPVALVSDYMCVICDRRKTQPV